MRSLRRISGLTRLHKQNYRLPQKLEAICIFAGHQTVPTGLEKIWQELNKIVSNCKSSVVMGEEGVVWRDHDINGEIRSFS
jgi:hypothetical protein